jgi:hypothetical protein
VLPNSASLLEREVPQRQLKDALEAARTGRGRIVSLEGEAGIGKTSLALSFAESTSLRCTSLRWRLRASGDTRACRPVMRHRTRKPRAIFDFRHEPARHLRVVATPDFGTGSGTIADGGHPLGRRSHTRPLSLPRPAHSRGTHPDRYYVPQRRAAVCDGSSLVTSGRGQPTMTIQALAFRAADHITRFARASDL